MSLKTFLENLKNSPVKGPVIRLVSGNQSCDMDSVVSAISYSYLFSKKNPSEPPFLPILNIKAAELGLRKDILLLLESKSITSNLLFFLEDVQAWEKENPLASFEVALVDHCNLQGEALTRLYEEKKLDVVSIIDHHQDEGVFQNATPRIIQTCGSCSSLVFNHWDTPSNPGIDSEVVHLLMGPLLLDTGNMSLKVEKGDVDALKRYRDILSQSGNFLDSTNFAFDGLADNFDAIYNKLKKAKKDLSGFSPHDIFLKDFKQFVFNTKGNEPVSIGFSSIGKPISWLLKNFTTDEFTAGLANMQKEFALDVVMLTTSFGRGEDKVHARELYYYAHDAKYANIADYTTILDLNSDVYKFDAIEKKIKGINKNFLFKVYNMGNTEASRKQIVPEIKRVIENNYE